MSYQVIWRQFKEDKFSEGDGYVLSLTVNWWGKFASKVLKEIANNSEENLLNLNKTCFDSIHVTEWINKLTELTFRPEITRAVPGEESVSIWYCALKQKHILIHSRNTLPSTSKRNRVWIWFASDKWIISTKCCNSNDERQQNKHANMRRVVRAIIKILQKKS